MTHYVIPLVVLGIIFYGLIKNVEIYDTFIDGVKEGLVMCFKIFPTMFAMIMCVDVLVKSGFLNNVTNLLDPVLKIFCFPGELLPLAIMRPISGNSSLMLLNEILSVHGPDSYLGRVASVIQGSTDTTIYIVGLYFSSIGIKKIKYSLIVGLLADLCAVILSVVIINCFFK